jgi:hypothetical protein
MKEEQARGNTDAAVSGGCLASWVSRCLTLRMQQSRQQRRPQCRLHRRLLCGTPALPARLPDN